MLPTLSFFGQTTAEAQGRQIIWQDRSTLGNSGPQLRLGSVGLERKEGTGDSGWLREQRSGIGEIARCYVPGLLWREGRGWAGLVLSLCSCTEEARRSQSQSRSHWQEAEEGRPLQLPRETSHCSVNTMLVGSPIALSYEDERPGACSVPGLGSPCYG